MRKAFQRIALVGKPDAERIAEIMAALYEHLSRRGCQLVVESACANLVSNCATSADLTELGRHCDLAIVIGGDGSLLSAARELARYGVPLIGINLGRLGFLVDISPSHALKTLDEILDGEYSTEERFLLQAQIIRNEQVIREQTAVNEVVVHSWNSTSMIEIVTRINGKFLNSQRSDGLIVSTPTGSTAYALSGGGPILYPTLNALVLVPINPHTLTNRPVVLADDSVIEISFRPSRQFRAQVACDSVAIPDVESSDRIIIRKRPEPFCIIHPLNYDFFEILRAKLNWSSGNRN